MNNDPPLMTSPAWTARTKRMVGLIAAGLIGLVVWQLIGILPIIIVAVILAYLFSPLVTFMDRYVLDVLAMPFRPVVRFLKERVPLFSHLRGLERRSVAVLLTFVVAISFLIVVILVVLPVLVNQFEEFGRTLPDLLKSLQTDLEARLSEPLTFNGEIILFNGEPFIPTEQLRNVLGIPESGNVFQLPDLDLVAAGRTFVSTLTSPVFSFVGGALTAVINLSFLLTMMFYLMRDGGEFADKIVSITPLTYQGDVRRLLYELAQVWNAYLRGQLILSLTMGTVVFFTATLLGVTNAPILGLLSGLLEFIPNIGPALALIPAALLALASRSNTLPFLEGVPFALVVIAAWTLLQNIEAIILVPRVMGGSLNLHPFVVIVAVLAGASVVGALGVILAAPMVASGRVFGQYLYGKLTDQNPFPEVRYRHVGRTKRGALWARAVLWLMQRNQQARPDANKPHAEIEG